MPKGATQSSPIRKAPREVSEKHTAPLLLSDVSSLFPASPLREGDVEEHTQGAFLFTKLVFSISSRAAAAAPDRADEDTILERLSSPSLFPPLAVLLPVEERRRRRRGQDKC